MADHQAKSPVRISAHDIEAKEFSVAPEGYHRGEVRSFLTGLAGALRRVRSSSGDAANDMAEALVTAAEDEAKEIRRTARDQARVVRREARQELDEAGRLRAEAEDRRAQSEQELTTAMRRSIELQRRTDEKRSEAVSRLADEQERLTARIEDAIRRLRQLVTEVPAVEDLVIDLEADGPVIRLVTERDDSDTTAA